MTDTKTTLTWVLKDEVSGPAKGIGSSLGGLVNPMTLAIGAAAGLGAALVGAVKAAAEEQVNIEKLNASLKANVEGFNGNTDAIEELISQRENLAFSDDEQRASLALLLAGTHDVTEAQNLQATAMDLARLKSVDLETATTAITKANQGSTRELKALGLEIDDTMTSTQILAAVQAAAAGQAEAYGDTLQGKWETFQIKIGDVAEDLGTMLLPAITGIADFLLDTFVPAVQDLVDAVGPQLQDAFRMATAGVDTLNDALHPLLKLLDDGTGKALTLIDVLGQIGNVFNPLGGLTTDLYNQAVSSGLNVPSSGRGAKGSTAPSVIPPHTQRASGGPVDPWGVYTVGEQGPETLVMGGQGGSIIPGGGGGGVPVVIPVMIDGREIARVVDDHLYYAVQRASPTAGRS